MKRRTDLYRKRLQGEITRRPVVVRGDGGGVKADGRKRTLAMRLVPAVRRTP